MYTKDDSSRLFDESPYSKRNPYRSAHRVDFDRLIHCPSFRRLQGKTQLYPSLESDFFRNRLTHSLEVAQVAKSIAMKINHDAKLKGDGAINLDIIEFAGLAHDLGHPPFGHQGEEMLDKLMCDIGGYEGNAQTLRILTKLEKKIHDPGKKLTGIVDGEDKRVGLNLTARTLAAVFKYDNDIPFTKKKRIDKYKEIHPVKGYYTFDKDLIKWIKKSVVGDKSYKNFKTLECQIMDLADDISYSTYDLEDGLKAGFFTLHDTIFASEKKRKEIAQAVNKKFEQEKINARLTEQDVSQILRSLFEDALQIAKPVSFKDVKIDKDNFTEYALLLSNVLYETSKNFNNGFARTYLTSKLVDLFIRGIKFSFDKANPSQSKVAFDLETLKKVEVLKKYTFISQILSPKLKIVEYRGKEIVKEIFKTLSSDKKRGFELLPDDYRELYESVSGDKPMQKRVVCDFVAGMTDRYAIEFYGRLKSENPETIFKPF